MKLRHRIMPILSTLLFAFRMTLLPNVLAQQPPARTTGNPLTTPSRPLTYLPLVASQRDEPCGSIPGESYSTLTVNPPPTDRPAESHPDLNLALRGYVATNKYRGLIDYGGSSDSSAPQLAGLFADHRAPNILSVDQVYDWDWANNRRGALITSPEVTLMSVATVPGETLHVPSSGYAIGDGYEVLVLYVGADRITLKYTREDNVIQGYTIHVENICPEPRLRQLYAEMVNAGRQRLPALRAGQAFGRASGGQIGVAIRDQGAFMDPRSRKDWWQGY